MTAQGGKAPPWAAARCDEINCCHVRSSHTSGRHKSPLAEQCFLLYYCIIVSSFLHVLASSLSLKGVHHRHENAPSKCRTELSILVTAAQIRVWLRFKPQELFARLVVSKESTPLPSRAWIIPAHYVPPPGRQVPMPGRIHVRAAQLGASRLRPRSSIASTLTNRQAHARLPWRAPASIQLALPSGPPNRIGA